MPLDPKFSQAVREALQTVTTHEVGPIEEDGLIADLGLDSVSMMELITVLEDKLNTTIDERKIVELRTFGDLSRLVNEQLSGPPRTP